MRALTTILMQQKEQQTPTKQTTQPTTSTYNLQQRTPIKSKYRRMTNNIK